MPDWHYLEFLLLLQLGFVNSYSKKMNWEIQKNLINLIVHGFIAIFWLMILIGVGGSGDKSILNHILFVFCAIGGIIQLIIFNAHMDGLAKAIKKYEEKHPVEDVVFLTPEIEESKKD